ncbi:MAG: hypothetical protein DWQ36_01810 [Acidobacteria bacterium]|nr:MAG: hypothetical protein DWQ30_16655 [Acidobacteriota bacterium]REK11506.1 MAG: hypothetical protein DWQ36_01810 [Acidobacteriota bacterium]
MSFLRRILGGSKTAEDVQGLLESGDARRALAAARKLDPGAVSEERRAELEASCERALLEATMARVDAALEVDHLEDAAEWIRIARQQLSTLRTKERAALESELAERIAVVEERSSRAAAEAMRRDLDAHRHDEADPDDDETPLEAAEQAFEVLIDTLGEEAAILYREAGARSAAFRAAAVAVSEGSARAALEQLEAIEEELRAAPAVVLERGRALLLDGQFGLAREAFEAVEDHFAAHALDQQGALSWIELWSEAALESDAAAEVLERLESSQELSGATSPTLLELHAAALRRAGREDEAIEALRAAGGRFPLHNEFDYRLAVLLCERGRHEESEEVLAERIERGLRPGGQQLLHPGSLELLCEHLLCHDPVPVERASELLDVTVHLLGGTTANVAWLRSHVLRHQGRVAEADAAAEVARELRGRTGEGDAADGGGATAKSEHRLRRIAPPEATSAAG